ncbi:hypothetical protein [Flavobacterium sp. M31R6]|uniref:hypothetical protein n=1 Tax=Flavobacterium sp. M31R6 TaxID=2739062 RepID=UPI001569F719|nr:hypothetical protein [Flavobacterium sp. M31R6]QKJ63344.1 hypothetical protein HQN62_09425 [Flavobacterium sp. M31R6]
MTLTIVIIILAVLGIIIYSNNEKKDLDKQNSDPIIRHQKAEANRKELEAIKQRNLDKEFYISSKNEKDYTNNLIKTKGYYVAKIGSNDGYMFFYFRKDGYVFRDFQNKLLNTEAVTDTKNYVKRMYGILNGLTDEHLGVDFGKYYVEGNTVFIDFLFTEKVGSLGHPELESSISIIGKINHLNIDVKKATSKFYKSSLRIFEERTFIEPESFSYHE